MKSIKIETEPYIERKNRYKFRRGRNNPECAGIYLHDEKWRCMGSGKLDNAYGNNPEPLRATCHRVCNHCNQHVIHSRFLLGCYEDPFV